MSKLIQRGICTLMLSAIVSSVFADVKLASPFTNHMVLQYNMPVPVWGIATPGEKVTVKFGKQIKTAITGADGKWMIKLDKLKPGGPFSLSVIGNNKIVLTDVYAGDVWLCSGQSNMDMTVAREDRYWCGVFDEKFEVDNANYPLIRVFDTDFAPSAEPKTEVAGKWEVVSPKTVGHISAAAYFFARDLQKKIKIPIGLITTSFGASTAEAWTRKEALQANPKTKYLVDNFEAKLAKYQADTVGKAAYQVAYAKWKIESAKAKAEGKDEVRGPKNNDPVRDQHNASVLWNGMVAPLIPYAIKGEIWYQGESNSPTASIFGDINETMITDWRKQWAQGDFPFIYVQLANIGKSVEDVPAKGGQEAVKREAQLQNLSIPNSAMVCAIDNADPLNMNNVHCKNKQAIGYRLALAAQAIAYHINTPYSGPQYDKMEVKGNTIRLYFKHTNGGLITRNGSLDGFAIAGQDKKFVWGTAKIEGNTIVVSNTGIEKPVAVRYAWGNNPPTSLYNGANLPAIPFRTDND
ncbi:sialate O-acetylesterase [Mucilaginibacter sp. HMF5004]|uniref:sialate O-acetylesterase n=1 Tax=Mucilaginibacter rivuli TaxID=2857527 RepID=UPI001C5EB8EC|nr:sialate O-acetylesterase [Mucilaginibacter rivuli]MBW4891494.1 sialate O-acetylesterase [Mucilaginibacter rivuli]